MAFSIIENTVGDGEGGKHFQGEVWRLRLITLTILTGLFFLSSTVGGFFPQSFHILSFLNSEIKKREAARLKLKRLIINPQNLKFSVDIFKLKIV